MPEDRVLTSARLLATLGWLSLLLLGSVAASLLLPVQFGLSEIFPLDVSSNPHAATLLLIRLPRALLGMLVGAALAVVGVSYQALLRNPLADPFVMGVSGGAALGGALALVAAEAGFAVQAACSFAGAAAATLLVYRLGRVGGRVDTLTVLLVGVVFNAFASAVITFLKAVISATKTQQVLFWLMGCLGYPSYSTLVLVAAVTFLGVGLLCFNGGSMNAMALGEGGAASLGVDVERAKTVIFVTASLLVGVAVAVSGMIGFVGLMVPHLMRLVLGPDHRLLLPASALAGGAFLLLADLAARLLFVPLQTEPPVGVVTAFLGGPFFLLLLRRRYRHAFF